jgi:hypothetical protein
LGTIPEHFATNTDPSYVTDSKDEYDRLLEEGHESVIECQTIRNVILMANGKGQRSFTMSITFLLLVQGCWILFWVLPYCRSVMNFLISDGIGVGGHAMGPYWVWIIEI